MRIYLLLLFVLSEFSLMAQEYCPPGEASRLFYIQRTGNSDTIVYDANLDANGRFQPNKPIDIYWRRASKNGQREELNYLQRTQAYGIKFVRSQSEEAYSFHLLAYPQRSFYLKKDDCGQPVVLLMLQGKEAYVQRIFIQLEPAKFGLKPTVHYIEIFGLHSQTGERLYEKVLP